MGSWALISPSPAVSDAHATELEPRQGKVQPCSPTVDMALGVLAVEQPLEGGVVVDIHAWNHGYNAAHKELGRASQQRLWSSWQILLSGLVNLLQPLD